MAAKKKTKVTAKAPRKKGPRKKAPPKRRAAHGRNKFPKPDPIALAREINMLYGDAGPVIRPANEAWDAIDLRRTCGIPSLDIKSGGGLPAGKICQIDGPESTGKNYILYRYFADVQRRYGDASCLGMACFESFVDKQFAQMAGCKIAMSPYDIEVSNRARAQRGEPPLTKDEEEAALSCPEVGQFMIFDGPAEGVLNGVVKAVGSNSFQLLGIDSWDALMTHQERGVEIGETPQVASPASMQTLWAKKVQDALKAEYRCPECGFSPLDKKVTNAAKGNYNYVCPSCSWKGLDPYTEVNETTILAIRQVRAKINMGGGKQYGRKYKTDGAYALQHANHIRISLHAGQYIKDGKIKIGKEVNWEISKAKGGAHEGATGMFQLCFDPLEVDVVSDLFGQCLQAGVVVSEKGSFYDIPDIEEWKRVKGKDALLIMIEQEPELQEALWELLLVGCDLAHLRFT